MIVYCDGIFDLLHMGHIKHFKKIHALFDKPIQLLVGIISDKIATGYKRAPILNEQHRLKMILSLSDVHDAFITDMLIVTEDFLIQNKVDFVVHGFSNSNDKSAQDEFFKVPIALNKFLEVPYNTGISTTEIIGQYYSKPESKIEDVSKHTTYLSWKEIWEKKGQEQASDLYVLNGWEETDFEPKALVEKMTHTLNINPGDKVMEYGCGAGLLSLYLKEYEYYGLDYSSTLVSKHIQLLNNTVFNFSSTDVLFKSQYFDFVIINSMLEYLPSFEDVQKTIIEIERITKKGIYIANIRFKSRIHKLQKHKYEGEFTHLVIDKDFFIQLGYTVIDSLYDKDRYDVYKLM